VNGHEFNARRRKSSLLLLTFMQIARGHYRANVSICISASDPKRKFGSQFSMTGVDPKRKWNTTFDCSDPKPR